MLSTATVLHLVLLLRPTKATSHCEKRFSDFFRYEIVAKMATLMLVARASLRPEVAILTRVRTTLIVVRACAVLKFV